MEDLRIKLMSSGEDSEHQRPNASKRATAYHEAGHAVMAMYLEREIQKVTIASGQLTGGGSRLGQCEMKKGRSKKRSDDIEDDALILIAGMVAESHFTGCYNEGGARQDLIYVQRLFESRSRTERELSRNLKRLLSKAEHILSETVCEMAIESIAAQLEEQTSIGGRQARHLYKMAEQKAGS